VLPLASLSAVHEPFQQQTPKDEQKEELIVDDQQADKEEADFDDNDETEANPQANVPAEEQQPQPTATYTWQSTGHSTYIKVEKQPTSKDEEANVDAEQLIEAISFQTPTFPSSLADVIALGDATRSTAWGAIS
jgi:hypothetical protein